MHARIAAKRVLTPAGTVPWVPGAPVFAVEALALVEEELFEELPQAASARLASTIANRTAVAVRCL
jgi:hypothetical protein